MVCRQYKYIPGVIAVKILYFYYYFVSFIYVRFILTRLNTINIKTISYTFTKSVNVIQKLFNNYYTAAAAAIPPRFSITTHVRDIF